jgi:hypothetical protein
MAVGEGATRSAPATEGLDVVLALHHHSSPPCDVVPDGVVRVQIGPRLASVPWVHVRNPLPLGAPLKPWRTCADSLNRGAMDLCS